MKSSDQSPLGPKVTSDATPSGSTLTETPIRTCYVCQRTSLETRFYPKSRAYCAECSAEKAAKWRATNKGREKEITRKYRSARLRLLAQKQLDRRAKDPVAWHRKQADYYKRNAHRLRWAARHRGERLRSTVGYTYTTQQHIEWRVAMWGGRCWMCGAPATAIDHVKPIAKGGSSWPANLRPACKSCNSRKRDCWPIPTTTTWLR